jgi:hypothetical protein
MAMLASKRLRTLTAAAAAAILGIGFLLKPAAPAAPPPDEAPAPILQQVVQQREADAVFRRMRDAAPQAVRFAARLTPLHPRVETWSDWQPTHNERTRADRFAAVLDTRHLLGDAADLDEGARVRVMLGDGRTFEARVTTRFVSRSLAVLEPITEIQLDGPPKAPQPVIAGTAAFATAPGSAAPIVAPLFVAGVTSRELLTTNALDGLRGMPVFTLDGNLAGIVAVEESRARVLTLDAAMAVAPAGPREPLFGFTLSVQPGDAGEVVTVTDVAPSGPAEQAGVRAGDVVIAMNGQEITNLENAVSALSAGDALTITVRRGSRVQNIRVPSSRGTSR